MRLRRLLLARLLFLLGPWPFGPVLTGLELPGLWSLLAGRLLCTFCWLRLRAYSALFSLSSMPHLLSDLIIPYFFHTSLVFCLFTKFLDVCPWQPVLPAVRQNEGILCLIASINIYKSE